MDYGQEQSYPVGGAGFTTEHAAAVIVIGALAALVLLRRGFRGVNVGGVSVGIR